MYTYKENRFENYQKDIISMMFSARKMLNFTLKIVPGTGARFWVVTSWLVCLAACFVSWFTLSFALKLHLNTLIEFLL